MREGGFGGEWVWERESGSGEGGCERGWVLKRVGVGEGGCEGGWV